MADFRHFEYIVLYAVEIHEADVIEVEDCTTGFDRVTHEGGCGGETFGEESFVLEYKALEEPVFIRNGVEFRDI